MKVLLVSFQSDLDTIGLKYIHYYLLKNDHDSAILYIPYFKKDDRAGLEEIKKFVMEMKPGLIGVSLLSTEYNNSRDFTKYIKSFYKSAPIIWGGIHPMILPESCLSYADYVCIGEGEKAVIEIANAADKNENLKNINNLAFIEDGKVRRNPLNPLIEDLDAIPSYEHITKKGFIMHHGKIADLDKKMFGRYDRFHGRIHSIITTRGCPYFCTYCCNNFLSRLYKSRMIRRRSIANVMEELEKALKDNPEIEYINFLDDCFLANSEDHLRQFCKIYKERIGKPFVAKAMPSYITRDKMMLLKNAGITWIEIGLQSGSNRVCKDIYKRSSGKEAFIKAAEIISEFKVAPYYDVILDNPFENEIDRLETIDTLIKTPKPFYTQFYSLTFYPGTELYEKAKSECPEYLEDCTVKDYFIQQKNTINNLTKLAAFLEGRYMSRIINMYKSKSGSIVFKMCLFVANLLNITIIEPITYLRVIKLSQGGSWIKTIKILPTHFREWLVRYTAL